MHTRQSQLPIVAASVADLGGGALCRESISEDGDDECLDGGMQLLEEFATIDFHNTIHVAKMLRMSEIHTRP